MIDKEFKVRRYIAIVSNKTENLVDEIDLNSFDLRSFQNEFGMEKLNNPMFDCYPILLDNTVFIERYLSQKIGWDFVRSSYFLESSKIGN